MIKNTDLVFLTYINPHIYIYTKYIYIQSDIKTNMRIYMKIPWCTETVKTTRNTWRDVKKCTWPCTLSASATNTALRCSVVGYARFHEYLLYSFNLWLHGFNPLALQSSRFSWTCSLYLRALFTRLQSFCLIVFSTMIVEQLKAN